MPLLICALLPIACSALLALMRKARRGLRMAAAVGYLIFTDAGGRFELLQLTERFVFALRLDGAGKVYIGLAAALWPLSVLYAVEYMRHEKREGNFFAWYLLSYGAAILLSAADNLFTLYIS